MNTGQSNTIGESLLSRWLAGNDEQRRALIVGLSCAEIDAMIRAVEARGETFKPLSAYQAALWSHAVGVRH